MLETELLEVDGRRVRCARLGSGPPVVFTHGYPENLHLWGEVARRLAARFSVIAFDWPGMGESEPWPGGKTPLHLAAQLARLFDAWNLRRASVVGLDMGAQPALAFAALHPQRIERLVAMNALVLWDEKTSWEIAVLRRFGWNQLALRRLPGVVFRRAESTFLSPGARLPADLREELWRCFRRPEVRDHISRMCAGYQGTLPQLPELYAGIHCPALILWGERERHFPRAHADRLQRLVPGAKLEVIAPGQHWMAWEQADQVADRLALFLAAPAAAGRA